MLLRQVPYSYMPQMESAAYLKLLERIADGSATDQEISQYNFWISNVGNSSLSWENEQLGDKHQIENEVLTRILSEIHHQLELNKPVQSNPPESHLTVSHPVEKGYKLWKRISTAAAVLLISGMSFYALNHHTLHLGLEKTTIVNDIPPGTDQAILTLANGKKIVLDGAVNGKIAEQAGISITKTADGQLVYELRESTNEKGSSAANDFNTIATPRGGQYQLNLPDGTRVWLNAASSLKYPIRFGEKNREVELQGEGYFEVSKDPSRPFKVKSGTQELEVLGTHFNVNSYSDDPARKTTLMEGSVRISSKLWIQPKVLLPGQQAIASNNGVKIVQVNPEEILDWKNGNFVFQDEPLESIMRKVARWYDVEVSYQGAPADLTFTGVVSRAKNISAVLNALDKTGKIHFKVEGKKVTVL